MKQFFAKAFFVIISLISGYVTSYYLVQFTCANQSPIYTRQYGPPSDLLLCHYKATTPAAVTGLLIGLLVLYIFLKTVFKYSIKSYGIFLLKLVVYTACVWGFSILLFNPVSKLVCNFITPELELGPDMKVVPGNWGACHSVGYYIKVSTIAGLLSTILTAVAYFSLTKWIHTKKKS